MFIAISQIASLAEPVDVTVIPPYSPPPGTGFGIVTYSSAPERSRWEISIPPKATASYCPPRSSPSLSRPQPGSAFPSVSGLTYRIQKSDTLASGGWTTAATLPAGRGINRERSQHRENSQNPYERPLILHPGREGRGTGREGNGRFVRGCSRAPVSFRAPMSAWRARMSSLFTAKRTRQKRKGNQSGFGSNAVSRNPIVWLLVESGTSVFLFFGTEFDETYGGKVADPRLFHSIPHFLERKFAAASLILTRRSRVRPPRCRESDSAASSLSFGRPRRRSLP